LQSIGCLPDDPKLRSLQHGANGFPKAHKVTDSQNCKALRLGQTISNNSGLCKFLYHLIYERNVVRLLDLQASTHQEYFRTIHDWRPDAVGYSLNYLANIPEVVDLAKATRRQLPEAFLFAGGNSASFTANEILQHAGGPLDCMVKGERERITPRLLPPAEGQQYRDASRDCDFVW